MRQFIDSLNSFIIHGKKRKIYVDILRGQTRVRERERENE